MRHGIPLVLAILATLPALADSPQRIPTPFATTWNVGANRSVYVVGAHADIGAWAPVEAVKLHWTAGNVWTGLVAVQAGTPLEYKFIARSNAAARACDPNNVEWTSGSNAFIQIPPAPPAPYAGHTLYYHSSWTNASLIYRVGTNWFDAPFTRLGFGRTTNEFLYRASAIGIAGEPLEFVPHGWFGGSEFYDHAPYPDYGGGNYYTTLDVCFLQDGNIFNYTPPAAPAASLVIATNVGSSFAGIPGRNISIYLPRGYQQNTWKRYPVFYMHDGQNLYPPGAGFGHWNVKVTADKEISQGRMREAIIVGIDNNANRFGEYCPPGDSVMGTPGIGDQYCKFVVNNVRPTIDTHFRTLNDPPNTMITGSSLGGLISAYFGWETNVFGAVGVMSPSFWTAPNFVSRIDSGGKRPIRIYLDVGTDEGGSAWDPTWAVYDLFQTDGYAENFDLRMVVGCGHLHNEAAWAQRLPGAFHFLLDARDEPNPLALDEYPPRLTALDVDATNGARRVTVPTMLKHAYRLERSDRLAPPAWVPVAIATGSLPWSSATLADTSPPPTNAIFYRVTGE